MNTSLTNPAATDADRVDYSWVSVCALDRLEAERGVAALIPGADGSGAQQVAIIRSHSGELYAVSNRDPYSGANVMSRGVVGTRADVPTLTSPVFKQAFDLRTGVCLTENSVRLTTYATRVLNGLVEVSVEPEPPA